MSNNEFFQMSIDTINEIGSKIDMDNLSDFDITFIHNDILKLTNDLLAAYGYSLLKKEESL